MKKIEHKMLKDLYESVKGLYAYTFYSRYSIEPAMMFEFITRYSDKGVLIYENDMLKLTDEGRKVILKQVFFNKTQPIGIYSNIPREFLGQKIEINLPYLPDKKDVPVSILKIKKVE